MLKKIVFAVLVAAFFLGACKKQNEDFVVNTVADFAPLKVGKYITYQLDSFRYLPFSTQGVTISYQVKLLVEAAITDNQGRPAYRIVRSIRSDTAAEFIPDFTFSATNTGNGYEYLDNNMRFLKLAEPIENGFTWKGNSFINTTTQFTDFRYLDGWDYMYDSLDAPLSLGGITVDSAVKVAQRDEIIGNPDDPNSYSEKNFGVEYYARGIGLVYKSIFHSEYQPPTSGGSGYYSDASKGYTMRMIDHN